MDVMKRILAIVACGLICGCETTDTARQNSAQQFNSSTYVHPATKFTFPEAVGAFHRVEVRKYDSQGKDVGVGYNSPTPIVATVYVYPGPKDVAVLPSPKLSNVSEALLDQHYQACKQDILRNHPDAKLINEGPCKLVQGEKQFEGKKATFSMDYKFEFLAQPSVSELNVFLVEPGVKFLVSDRQFVKYRLTYPTAKKGQAETEVAAFMTALDWPTK